MICIMIMGSIPLSLYGEYYWEERVIDLNHQQEVSKADIQWQVILEEHNQEQNNIIMDQNKLSFHCCREEQGKLTFSFAEVESKQSYQYGYIAFALRGMGQKGLVSSVALCSDQGELYPKVDIIEQHSGEGEKIYGITHFFHRGWYARDFFVWKMEQKDEHLVALEWNEDYLAWYIDGEKVYQTTKGVPKEYMYIQISQEVDSSWLNNHGKTELLSRQLEVELVQFVPVNWKNREI